MYKLSFKSALVYPIKARICIWGGSSREEAGKGRCYMTEPSVTEESSEEKLEDSKS